MKTLVIERPEHLKNLTHEIRWTSGDFDLRETPREFLIQSTHFASSIGGGPTAVSNYVMATQLLEGVVLMVDERVSRDLELSTIAGSLENLSWPAGCMEMRFQDPGLPAIILCPSGVRRNEKEAAVAFATTDRIGATLSLALPESMWQKYIQGDIEPHMEHRLDEDLDMDSREAAALRYLATLAIKVIAYSSIPQHAPVPVVTRAEKKAAGIHPKHVLENQKALVVRYLPRVISTNYTKTYGEGKKRAFMGRAGHIRFFKSDFFKNVKGQWKLIAPIPPPEGIKVTYRIRSVKP